MTSAVPARKRGRPPASAAGPGETRERIVRAALELFAEKGFHGTGVAEIGDRADVQRGALYYHIGSKEELLWQILADYTRLMLAEAEQIVSGSDYPVTKLRKLIHSHVRLILENRRAVAIQLRDVTALTGERGRELQELRDRIQSRWQQVIDAGKASGVLRTADHVVTNGLLGMLNSVTFWYRADGQHTPDEIADILCTTVLDGLIQPRKSTKG
ncbi:TetR/AcrR family transcriptional regulator [Nocardia sp. CDC153]|uniref:TetR/AcrR family transcriptional regulator n=1 Tax=Nocardia sp. CDC153 TaxID=3112167 RepID=UPI002DB5836D|nr:TetR/AcrR family transcriptional regulator [Nocardia sp. CDC153]MEC3955981.1 TetR/AcrR family transcriptional regulator [Nocardia sp. CDC153]